MKPERRSKTLLGIARSSAKMIEYSVPEEDWIKPDRDPEHLFSLTVALLGDLAAKVAREGGSLEVPAEQKQTLRFSAFFFDAYLYANELPTASAAHVSLLASAAYYLCDLPGSSSVLARQSLGTDPDNGSDGLDRLALWLLRSDFSQSPPIESQLYSSEIHRCIDAIARFYTGDGQALEARGFLGELRARAYGLGSPRELLLADIVSAVGLRRLETSARACLPRFSDLPIERWDRSLRKDTFLREFWPAQLLLGERGVFRGRSALVQMPTSAGKTKATEVLVRSAFLSGRTNLVVIVAPFRALCHEIRDSLIVSFRDEDIRVDEVSDVPQDDFSHQISDVAEQCVLVLTPEKLLYILRQDQTLANRIGLLVYDEGHQFDSGIRGVTYELLLTSLKALVSPTCQVVLISAVLTNAEAINEWLNGVDSVVVSGSDLLPNFRSIAFTSWTEARGRLEFTPMPESGDYSYFVPRVLEKQQLNRLSSRETPREFPTLGDPQTIALYFAIKLAPNGAVALFCGTKRTAKKLCTLLNEAYRRGLSLPMPVSSSDAGEVEKIASLIERHLGEDDETTRSARIGVFTHHGSTPMGVRLAVEHAMKTALINVVICTSTLAQGVNLPIRYLIVSGVRQGRDRITVRDFQNLIGRAGRSGMHTEGSVIFADPHTYDRKDHADGRDDWQATQELLDPKKATACASSLLSVFKPVENEQRTRTIVLNFKAFLESHLAGESAVNRFTQAIVTQYGSQGFNANSTAAQLQFRVKVIDAIASYLMSVAAEEGMLDTSKILELASNTLAHQLADNESTKRDLENLFQQVATHIAELVPEPSKLRAYSKSLFGVRASIAINDWVVQNYDHLKAAPDDRDLLDLLWPLINQIAASPQLVNCTRPEELRSAANDWIEGTPYVDIFSKLQAADARFGAGARPQKMRIDQVVDFFENVVGFEGVLVMSAVSECLALVEDDDGHLGKRVRMLQKRMKYGLADLTSVSLFEMGFADRILAPEVAKALGVDTDIRGKIVKSLNKNMDKMLELLQRFPSYYSFVLQNILNS